MKPAAIQALFIVPIILAFIIGFFMDLNASIWYMVLICMILLMLILITIHEKL
jgi:hypothetical protein